MAYKLEWNPSPNFTSGSRTKAVYGQPRSIKFGAGHWWNVPGTGTTHDGVVRIFKNPARQGSTHAVLSEGRVTEMVRKGDTAWTTNNANPYTYSIETRPEIMYKWQSGVSAAQRALGNAIFETLAEYIADKGFHNLQWFPHKKWFPTQCNPIRWNEVMTRAKQIHAAKNNPAPTPTPKPPTSNITYTKLSKPIVMTPVNDKLNLYAFNEKSWGSIKTVKTLKKGSDAKGSTPRITIVGKGYNKTLKSTYLMTEFSFNRKIPNGFNQVDLEAYKAPVPPKPEWIRNMKKITAVRLTVLPADGTEIVDLENGNVLRMLAQGTNVDFVKQTTVDGVVYLISSYSASNGLPNGIIKSEVGVPAAPPKDKPEWLENWKDIEDKTMYARLDAEIVNLLDGTTIGTLEKGKPVEIASATSWMDKPYLISKYSTDKKIPNGIAVIDLSDKPVNAEVPIETDPEQPIDDVIDPYPTWFIGFIMKLVNAVLGIIKRKKKED